MTKRRYCPGSALQSFTPKEDDSDVRVPGCLRQFPIQIKLLPTNAPYFNGADLLIAADCTAYAYGNFHHDFIRGKITLIGCPKLDAVDYSEKLTEIFHHSHKNDRTMLWRYGVCDKTCDRSKR